MIEGKDSINLFPRDQELEKIIDRKLAFHYLHTESLSLFLDLSNELIYDYNENQDRYSKGKLYDFLKFRRMRIERDVDNIEFFNNEEINYINKFREYFKDLRSILFGKSFDQNQLIRHFINFIEKCSLENKDEPELLIELLRKEIYRFDHIYCTINNKSGNIYLYIHKYKYCITIINNAIEFELVDHRWLTSLIVSRDVPDVFSSIKNSNNIDYISYKISPNIFGCVYIKTPLDWCLLKVENILNILNKIDRQEILKEKLLSIKNKAKSILSLSPYYPVKINHLNLGDVRLLRKQLIGVLSLVDDDRFLDKRIALDVKSIVNTLSATYHRIVNCLELESKVYFSLSEIKKNNTLYIVSRNNKKNESYSYGEENLTSILASNLRCLYIGHSNISVSCEAMVGHGRSDIRLSMGEKTFGIIEAKLLSKNSNVEDEIRNGIDQLYSRYGENEDIEGDVDLNLYLILFSYDKDFRQLAKSIKRSICIYSERNGLEYEKISMTENGVLFRYKELRNDFDFLDKIRTINIMVCNMEIDYKSRSKQRTSNKTYDPSKIT